MSLYPEISYPIFCPTGNNKEVMNKQAIACHRMGDLFQIPRLGKYITSRFPFRKKIFTAGDIKEGWCYHHRMESVFSVDEKVSPRCKPDLSTISAKRRKPLRYQVVPVISGLQCTCTCQIHGRSVTRKSGGALRSPAFLCLWCDGSVVAPPGG